MSAPLGPFATSSDALLAVRPADGSFAGPKALSDLISSTLREAGVEMAAWDWRVASSLAGMDVQTVASVVGWVQRAHQSAQDVRDGTR